jgi:hypothetical protein
MAFLVGLAPKVVAATDPLAVVVVCSELSAEERDHVEAMVRADFLARGQTVTRVDLECQADWVMVRVAFGAGNEVSHGEPKASAHSQIIEQLITLPDGLSVSDSAQHAQASAEPSALPARRSDAEVEPSSEPQLATSGAPTGFALPSGPMPRLRLELHGTVRPRRSKGSTKRGFELLAGLEFDLALPDSWGLLGPRLGVAVDIGERLAVVSVVGVSWAVEPPNDTAMRDQRVGLGFEWRLGERFALDIVALLTALHVSVPEGFTPRSRWSELEPACQLGLGYHRRWASTSLGIYPTITAYAHPRTLLLNGLTAPSNSVGVPQLLFGVVAQTGLRL